MLLVAVFVFAAWLITVGSVVALFLGLKAYANPGTDWVLFGFAVKVFGAPWLLFLLGGRDGVEIALELMVNPYRQDSGIPMWVFQPVGVALIFMWWRMRSRPMRTA